VNLIPRNSTTDENQITDESIQDSLLTVADNGRAQFIGVNVDTFAIRPASAASLAM